MPTVDVNPANFAFQIITVDGAIFQIVDDQLCVLLIQRGFEPFLHEWALPGVYIPREESSLQALERALVQKTGTSLKQIELIDQPFAFDAPGRDPRGQVITIVHTGLCRAVRPGDHPSATMLQNPKFVPVQGLPKLAYDHNSIIAFAHHRLQLLAGNTNALAALLPKTFTLSELQHTYEAIFCKPLDKRNFRKKILSLDLLEEVAAKTKTGPHRPAQLYQFRTRAFENTAQSFA